MTFGVLTTIAIIALIVAATRGIYVPWFTHYLKFFYSNAAVWIFLYFSAWATVIALLFPPYIVRLFSSVSILGYIVLVFLFIVAFPLIFRLLRMRAGTPEWLALMYPDEPILSPEERFILGKVGDVVFQDFAIGILILTFSDAGYSYPLIVGIFVALFAIAHLYIFLTSGFFWGLYYTTYAALGGFVFPFLILFIPGGIAYALIVHMLFYVVSAALFARFPQPSTAVSHHIVGHITQI